MQSHKSSAVPEDRIRAIAYSLWLEEGRPDGRAEAHWLKANALVVAQAEPNGASKTPPAKKAPRRKPS